MKKSAIKIKALEKQVKLIDEKHCMANAHLKEVAELRAKYSDMAISKAETALWERMDSSNHKYAQMKEQAGEFATKENVETAIVGIKIQLAWMTRIIWLASGALAVIIWLLDRME